LGASGLEVNGSGVMALDEPEVFLFSANRSRANVAHIRHSNPDAGLCFQVQVLKTCKGVPSSLGSSPCRCLGLGHTLGGACPVIRGHIHVFLHNLARKTSSQMGRASNIKVFV